MYIELAILNGDEPNKLQKIARKHLSTVASIGHHGPSGYRVVTFACPDRERADALVDRLHGKDREALDFYVVDDVQADSPKDVT